MKILIKICILFFLISCASDLKYQNVNQLNEIEKGETLQIAFGNYNAYGEKWNEFIPQDVKKYYHNIFGKYGLIEFEKKDKNDLPDYVAVVDGWCNNYNGVDVVPIWGKTGINSITTSYNSNTYGNLYTLGNTGYYNRTTYGSANSMVNYDYGVVGYNNVPYKMYGKSISFMIVKMNKYTRKLSGDMVYKSSFDLKSRNASGCNLEDDLKFLSISDNKFNNKLHKTSVNCYKNNGKYICNPDNGIFFNLWDRIFNSELFD